MSFLANALRVMMASTGDVAEEEGIIVEEIYRWNDAHAISRKLVLLPVKWDNHDNSKNGAPSQAAIDRQTLEEPDILIGIFGTGIGTLPEARIRGAVEAIKRHVGSGKTARVYFSEVPFSPSRMDAGLYRMLSIFQEECRAGGLCMTYNDLEMFQGLFRQYLSLELDQPRYRWLPEPSPSPQDTELPLSADARRILIAAAQSHGLISTIPAVGGRSSTWGARE